MRDTVTESKNNTRTIIVIIAILLFLEAIGLAVYSYKLDEKAVTIYSDVIEVNYNNKEYIATVRYVVNDNEYTKIIKTKSNKEIVVNDKIKITYDKDKPNNLINNKAYPIISAASFVVSVLLLIVFGPKFTKTKKRSKDVKRMIKENMYIVVPISEVIVDNTKKPANGSYAYKIRSKFFNKADNKEYVYESDSVYIDLNKLIQETRATTIKIYIDKTNTNNYYVDLESLYPDVPIIDPKIVLGGNKEKEEEKKVDQVAKEGEENTEQAKEGETNPEPQK